MNTFTKRIIPFILASLILLSSCGQLDSSNITNTDITDLSSETQTTAEPRLPQLDFNGKTFTILDSNPRWSGMFEMIDMYSDGENGEPINDAVYKRNSYVEETYNINIAESKTDDVYGDAQKSIMAGDHMYDMVWAFRSESVQLAQAGLFYNLNDMKYFDFTCDWWDQNAQRELSVAGKTFLMTGEITTMDDDNTTLMVFNKKILSDLELDEPYGLVPDYKWTWDAMSKIARNVYSDINGNGEYDQADRFGLLTQYYDSFVMMVSMGVQYVTINDSGEIDLTFMSERTVSAVNKLIDITSDKAVCILRQNLTGEDKFFTGINLFCSDNILFYISEPIDFPHFRDMESAWGILPMPMYDEAQEKYMLALDVGPICFGVPNNVEDPDMVSLVIEAMCEKSSDTLTPAYYDIVLKRKYSRDNESEKMLEIMRSSRSYDLAAVYNWGGIIDLVSSVIIKGKGDITSSYVKIEDKIKTEMQKTYDTIINIS